MNWLMYIGGGILFIKIVVGITSFIENDFEPELNFPNYCWANLIATLATWIWICWRLK